jgi:hypothetical protein
LFLVAVVTGLLALAATPAYAQGAWLTVRSMPTARDGLAAAAAPCLGDLNRTCVYAIGGLNDTGTLSTAEMYNPDTDTWTTLKPMPTARDFLAAAAAPCPKGVAGLRGTCVYAIGGGSGLNTVEAYSPETDTWATLPSMPTARRELAGAAAPCTAALHLTCVYAIGGTTTGGGTLNTVETYRPHTNIWSTQPTMPTARLNLAGAAAPCFDALNLTCVYAIGGENSTGFLTTAEAFAPDTNTWTTPSPMSMPTARNALAGAAAPCPDALNRTCVYAIGGFNNTGILSTAEAYSPNTNTWATLPNMPTARSAPAGAAAPCPRALNRTCVYVIGGFNSTAGDFLSTVEAFSPER